MRLSAPLAALSLALALTGCDPNVVGTTPDAGDVVDPGAGADAGVRGAYPAGPYGITVNQRIQNFTFKGYLSTQSTVIVNQGLPYSTTLDLQTVRSTLDPSGKPYRYLLMAISAVWCNPCNQEAESLGTTGSLHPRVQQWLDKGGLFMTVIIEGKKQGNAPTEQELATWITGHEVTNSIALDDGQQLANAGIDPYSIPANLVIDLETMKMVTGWAGIDDTYAKWEALLNK